MSEPSPEFQTFATAQVEILPSHKERGEKSLQNNDKKILNSHVMLNLFQHLAIGNSLRQSSAFPQGVRERIAVKIERGYKKVAFTLAEVLITLGIIGIVAAMTLPTLITKINERQHVSRLLKIYSILNQANSQVVSEIGGFSGWSLKDDNQSSTRKAFSYYEPYLKITEKCDNKSGCWASKSFSLTGQTAKYTGTKQAGVNYIGVKLLDGSTITFDLSPASLIESWGLPNDTESPYIIFWVDVNGDRLPNTLGKDMFLFATYQDRIIPAGYGNKSQKCKNKQGGALAGADCTWWVVENKNMDYLH